MSKIKLFIIKQDKTGLSMTNSGTFSQHRNARTKFFTRESDAKACVAGKIRAGNTEFYDCLIETVKVKMKFHDVFTVSKDGEII